MIGKNQKLMLALLGCILVSSCETKRKCPPYCATDEEVLAEAGAVRLTPEQVKAHVSGKTEDWVHGGAYYHANGKLEIKWLKVRYKTVWDVSASGDVCYQPKKWDRRCHFYMQYEGEILMLDEGKNIGARRMYDGNRLTALGRQQYGMERRK